MEEKDGVKYEDIITALSMMMSKTATPSSHSFDDFSDIASTLAKRVNGGTPFNSYSAPKPSYKLTKEKGYFIYWLMMHFAFLEDKGFNSQYKDISNNIPAWGRAIITERKYTEYDRAFLKEVTEWLPNSDWVYKKPVLNEHNDYHTILESLQSI
jgi:hypothetical protein